jgi:3-hydroxyisobutyrate dehydrogenase-like beta-hydroxyacid dehydrogenase
MNQATLIGFGEAGQAFAADQPWPAYDIDPAKSRAASLASALTNSPTVLSLVTADAAAAVATAAAPLLQPAALYLDMNSVAPGSKREAADAVTAAGGRYVDVAIMAPVIPARRATPLLLSGPYAAAGLATLTALGFGNVRIVGDEIGRASAIKMLRSVMYKGVEALTVECLIACEAAGVTEEVLGSFGNDWSEQADYRLDRVLVHGQRRSAEMREVVKTLEALGVDPLMTRGTAERQQRMGALGLNPPPAGLAAKLAALCP